jgi:endonuclease/exonuclease/phosphatase family metal-dependent hydrolase
MEFVRLVAGGGAIGRICRRFKADRVPEEDLLDDEWSPSSNTSSYDAAVASAEVRFLTLNTWGIPIAPGCHDRHLRLCAVLFPDGDGAGSADCAFDVIALQEVWHWRERVALVRAARKAGLRHHHYFEQGCGFPLWAGQTGTGVLVLSRFPIRRAQYHRYTVTGPPYMVHEADYLGAKGVGWCQIGLPDGTAMDVMSTHLLSSYCAEPSGGPTDAYYALRVAEAFELGQFAEAVAASGSALLVLAGDFNMDAGTLVPQLPLQMAGLTDAWAWDAANRGGKQGQKKKNGGAEEAAEGAEEAAGATYGTSDNAFSAGDIAARMDLVLYRAHDAAAAAAAAGGTNANADTNSNAAGSSRARLVSCGRAKMRDAQGALSDHWGVQATFALGGVTRATGAAGAGARLLPLPPAAQVADEALADEVLRLVVGQRARARVRQQRCWAAACALAALLLAVLLRGAPCAAPLAALLAVGACVAFFLGQFVDGEEWMALRETARQVRLWRGRIALDAT